MSSPCVRCESRGSCKHRTVEEPVMLCEPVADKVIVGSVFGLGGLHRKRTHTINSIRGKSGNPTRTEFDELIKDAFKKSS